MTKKNNQINILCPCQHPSTPLANCQASQIPKCASSPKVISLEEQKKERQRRLLFNKLEKDGFLE